MKRRRLRSIEQPGTARFLTFTCYRRLPLFRNAKIADDFARLLAAPASKLRVSVLGWVVLPNHVHLIVMANESDATTKRFTHVVKARFAQQVIKRWRTLEAPILSRIAHGDSLRCWQTGGWHRLWQRLHG